jgi:hypothetical protein
MMTWVKCKARLFRVASRTTLRSTSLAASNAGGWAALSALDTNHDGKIDAQDAQFSQLRVWVDANSDGITDAGELRGLVDVGVVNINLSADHNSVQQNGNVVQAFSTYTSADGQAHEVADVGLQISQIAPNHVFTLVDGGTFDLSSAINASKLTEVNASVDSASNTIKLTLNDLLSIDATNGVHKLVLTGDANDSVELDLNNWSNSGATVAQDGHTYAVYNANEVTNAQLLIDQAILNAGHVS